ncbi:MAG TPA: tyrosine-type recombinase/integrase [Actinomycetota bacterium]|nr:tyrosine-type recombinase/integrase [Actinomycetota bacterium]
MAWIVKVEGPRRGTRYRVEYRDPAGRHRTRTFRRRRDAEEFLHRVEVELSGGSWRDPAAAREPLSERIEAWLASRHDWRPTTRARREPIVRLYMLPRLGGVAVGALRPEHVRAWMAELLDGGVSPQTVWRARQLLHAVCEEAVRDGVIPSNPVRYTRPPRLPRPELRVPTPEEVERLVEAADEAWRPLVVLLAYGGLRIGEALGLRRRDLDLLARRVHVRRQAVEIRGRVELAEVKTAAGRRVVALPAFVAEALARHLEGRPADPEALVFADTRGGPVRRTNWRRRVWEPAVRAAGLEGLRPHDLRHFAATVAVAAGAHPRALQARLGHADSRTTLDLYASVLPGLDDELARRLEGLREEARRRALEGGRVVPLRR